MVDVLGLGHHALAPVLAGRNLLQNGPGDDAGADGDPGPLRVTVEQVTCGGVTHAHIPIPQLHKHDPQAWLHPEPG